MKIQRAVRGRRRALCLLSTLVSASRCRRTNEAALGRQGHFFVSAYYWFERRLARDPRLSTRQRRTPTKGRIRNTPKKGHRTRPTVACGSQSKNGSATMRGFAPLTSAETNNRTIPAPHRRTHSRIALRERMPLDGQSPQESRALKGARPPDGLVDAHPGKTSPEDRLHSH